MKILAAVDFSTATECILRAAKTYAQTLDAEVYLVHVESPEAVSRKRDSDGACSDIKTESSRLMKNAKALQRIGVKAIPVILQGAISKMLLAEAERLEADLIIAGMHGHGVLRNRLVGSATEGILRQSKIPVLLIPERG